MEPKRDSRVVAAQVAMDQLEAMGCERFDIGVKRVDGAMILREGWDARQVLKSLLRTGLAWWTILRPPRSRE